jgi:hypothetical protein
MAKQTMVAQATNCLRPRTAGNIADGPCKILAAVVFETLQCRISTGRVWRNSKTFAKRERVEFDVSTTSSVARSHFGQWKLDPSKLERRAHLGLSKS